MRSAGQVVFALWLLLGLVGCGYYNFSGATIAPEYQTIAIVPIENGTSSSVRDLEGELTDLLNERFVGRTRLRLETNANDADLVLTGRLTGFVEDRPTAISGDEEATRNEVTVRAEMRYRARESGEDLINETYTQSATYDLSSSESGNARDAALVALENIADAVFADATSNW